MNHHENIHDLAKYREDKAVQSVSEEETKILDTLNSSHPAGKQWAEKKLYEHPEVMVKYIVGKLEEKGYPEDVISGVPEMLEQLRADEKYRPSELAEGLYMEYSALLTITNKESEQRSAEAAKQNHDATLARASFKLVRDENND